MAMFSRNAFVLRLITIATTFIVAVTPALAFEVEEIGNIKANFRGEAIAQPTVLAKPGGKGSATAYLLLPGAGMSDLNLVGYSRDNKRLSIEVLYMAEQPDTKTAPMDLTIIYAPKGTKEYWTSEDAQTAGKITFTTLETKGNEGHAAGTFKALLCYAENHESGPDSNNCDPIEGSFDTRFFVEK